MGHNVPAIRRDSCRGRLAQWLSVRFIISLRQGTAVRISTKDLSFQTRFNRKTQLLDGTINHATYRKEAVATSLLSERERSPNKSTLWRHQMIVKWRHTYPTTILYNNEPATCYNNKLTSLIYDGDRAVDWKQAKTMEGSSATNKTR